MDLLRRKKGAEDYLDSIGDWSFSIVTGMELVAGAKNKDEIHEIDIVVATYEAVPLNSEIGELAYNLMKTYAKSEGLDPFRCHDRRNRDSRRVEAVYEEQKTFRKDSGTRHRRARLLAHSSKGVALSYSFRLLFADLGSFPEPVEHSGIRS